MTRSERLHPEVRAPLAMMDAQGAPPLESQDPVEARHQPHGAHRRAGTSVE